MIKKNVRSQLEFDLVKLLTTEQSLPDPDYKQRLRAQLLQPQHQRFFNLTPIVRFRLITMSAVFAVCAVIALHGIFGYFLPRKYSVEVFAKVYASNPATIYQVGTNDTDWVPVTTNFFSAHTQVTMGPAATSCPLATILEQNGYLKLQNYHNPDAEAYYYKTMIMTDTGKVITYSSRIQDREYVYMGGTFAAEVIREDADKSLDQAVPDYTPVDPTKPASLEAAFGEDREVLSRTEDEIKIKWIADTPCIMRGLPDTATHLTKVVNVATVDAHTFQILTLERYFETISAENLISRDITTYVDKDITVEEANQIFHVYYDFPGIEIRTEIASDIKDYMDWEQNTASIKAKLLNGSFLALVPLSSRFEYHTWRNYDYSTLPMEAFGASFYSEPGFIPLPENPQSTNPINGGTNLEIPAPNEYSQNPIEFSTTYALDNDGRKGMSVLVLAAGTTFEEYNAFNQYGEPPQKLTTIVTIDGAEIPAEMLVSAMPSSEVAMWIIHFQYNKRDYVLSIHAVSVDDISAADLQFRALNPHDQQQLQEYMDMVTANRQYQP